VNDAVEKQWNTLMQFERNVYLEGSRPARCEEMWGGEHHYADDAGAEGSIHLDRNLTSRDEKARINHRGMDANEEVQDRCSGRLPKCGA
jgi:hypothetical protein